MGKGSPAKQKRALSFQQAHSCENATTERCRCRCGGQFHGAKRNWLHFPDSMFLELLPGDDPHHIDAVPKQTGKAQPDTSAEPVNSSAVPAQSMLPGID
jgi:hypothetical protein